MPELLTDFILQNYITLALLLSLTVLLLSSHSDDSPDTHWVWASMGILLLLNTNDFIGNKLLEHHTGAYLLRMKTTFSYWFYPGLLMIQTLLVSQVRGKKRLLMLIPEGISILATIPSLFGSRLAFWLDSELGFHAGPLNIIPYIMSIIYIVMLIVISIVLIINKQRSKGAIAVFVLIITSLTVLLDITEVLSGYVDEIAATSILIYYFYLCAIRQSEAQKQLHRSELELEQSRVRLLQAQIQPHFIFNSLMAIQAQSIENPEAVYQSIGDFSGYLRANLDSMTSTHLISFKMELKNIERYLALERLNYEDRLHVVYDMDTTDFMIPALSVQPLVENAVRHGIGPHETGGTITISVIEEKEGLTIEVADDGSGADSTTQKQRERRGIGIQNVRARLKYLNIGTLEILTTVAGTRARIHIPNENKEEKHDNLIGG